MSELDSWFGPREPAPEPEEGGRLTGLELLAVSMQYDFKKRLRCEDRIKGALATFFAVMGEDYWPRSAKLRSQHYSAARDFVDEYGEDELAVRWALDQCRQRNVKVKTLRSTLFLAPEWRAIARRPELELDGEYEPAEMGACQNCTCEVLLERLENNLCVECRMLPTEAARQQRRERMTNERPE